MSYALKMPTMRDMVGSRRAAPSFRRAADDEEPGGHESAPRAGDPPQRAHLALRQRAKLVAVRSRFLRAVAVRLAEEIALEAADEPVRQVLERGVVVDEHARARVREHDRRIAGDVRREV